MNKSRKISGVIAGRKTLYLRLPADLYEYVEKTAELNCRSMNAEMISLIASSISAVIDGPAYT